MSRVLLVRHAPTAANLGAVFQGQRDTPALTEPLPQPLLLPDGPRTVYASPLQRARFTAGCLFPDDDAVVDARLLERSVGAWEGLTHGEVEERWPGAFLPDGSLNPSAEPPGGEPLTAFTSRVGGFLTWVDGRHVGDVYLVTHNGWIRVALLLAGAVERAELFRDPVPHLTPIELPQDWWIRRNGAASSSS